MSSDQVTTGTNAEEGELMPKNNAMDLDESDTPVPPALAVDANPDEATIGSPGGRETREKERQGSSPCSPIIMWRGLPSGAC